MFFTKNADKMIQDLSNKMAALRQDYLLKSLEVSEVDANPLHQLALWIEEAVKAELNEINAFHLSTVDAAGRPAGRIVLLKGIDQGGVVFYTNYSSDKGQDIAHNSNVAITFFWDELQRQVRINGRAEKVSAEESDFYFSSRPRESQLGAWASAQSEVVASRAVLEEKLKEVTQRFEGKEVPRPAHWGGYRVIPEYYEFWQGRASRLHDRIFYEKKDNSWDLGRLSP